MANLLTGVRVLLIIPVAWAFADADLLAPLLLLSLILLAIITDCFDGIVARASGTASPGGQLFDHGTDFAFVTSGLAGLAYAGQINVFLPPLIVLAFSQYVLDSYFLFRRKQLRMSFLGRWNGIFYFGPLLLFAASRLDPVAGIQQPLQWLGGTLAQLLVISTIASIIDRGLAPFHK